MIEMTFPGLTFFCIRHTDVVFQSVERKIVIWLPNSENVKDLILCCVGLYHPLGLNPQLCQKLAILVNFGKWIYKTVLTNVQET